MKIVVLNGSPKGDLGVTRQYIAYLEKIFTQHTFDVIHVGEKIKKIEKNNEIFYDIIKKAEEADAVVWCYPVYTLVVPYQLKRFIELIFERKAEKSFEGKYTTSVATSAHFYDHTALNYIHEISCDLQMNCLDGFSAGMNDLMKPEKRKNFVLFFEYFLSCAEKGVFLEKKYENYEKADAGAVPVYKPGKITDVPARSNKKAVVLTDATPEDTNLLKMIDVFVSLLPLEVKVINMHDRKLKGGCLGCIMCGYDGSCVYNDDFRSLHREAFLEPDVVIIAGAVRDRYLSSRWKLFWDRSFCNGHRPVTMGKQMGFIISGPLRQLFNLRHILEAYAEVGKMNLVGIITDEYPRSGEVTGVIKTFAQRVAWSAENDFAKPSTFLGWGGHLVFRDLIYKMRGLFRADDDFYRKKGLYNFPQRNIKARMGNTALRVILNIPAVRKNIYRKSREGMIYPHKRILNRQEDVR